MYIRDEIYIYIHIYIFIYMDFIDLNMNIHIRIYEIKGHHYIYVYARRAGLPGPGGRRPLCCAQCGAPGAATATP